MRARLAFACTLAQDSKILLLDEIFATGDQFFIEKSKNLMRSKINQSDLTIFVSHSSELVREVCNKALILHDGIMKMFGEVGEVVETYERE